MVDGSAGPLIRDISDTARWVAVYRARESDRPDAVFRDPYARRLAGERGEQIANALPFGQRADWAWTARTYLVDQYVLAEVGRGADLVVNLAAGLDARPYRMELPASLRWVEIDLPQILDYKEAMLAADTPRCRLERIRLDLSDINARRGVFQQLGASAKRVLILSEGLLIYFTEAEVAELARDLAAPAALARGVVDIASPGLVQMLQTQMGDIVAAAGAPYKFGPTEGPLFFTRCGWQPIEVRSMIKTARRLKRLRFFFKLMSYFPDPKGRQGKRPWSAACLLEKIR